jgi:hypothetical protein
MSSTDPASSPTEEERSLDVLLHEAHLAADHDLPGLFARHAIALGVSDPVTYVVDLQQRILVPFQDNEQPARDVHSVLTIDATLAGRAYQHIEVLTQAVDGASDDLRVWLPLLDGTERLGLLAVTVPTDAWHDGGGLQSRLLRFAAIAAEMIMTKTLYGDTLVRLRRTSEMSLSAELQWSLLPPLTFASPELTIAGGLEPAYDVAGDTIDYAVGRNHAHLAIFDGMGHGLPSAQLTALTVAAYRNARRGGKDLADIVDFIDRTVVDSFAGTFITGQIVELDVATGLLRWINVGHPDPLLIRNGRLVRELHAKPRPPFGLGALNQAVAEVGQEHLQPGDLVVLYSDGVTEARSPDGDFFGTARLVDLLVRNFAAGLPAPETTRRVIRSLLDHQEDQLADDASLLVLQYRPANQHAMLTTPASL